ncbi:MAG TPA: hypothetical protein VK171_05900 [Fimbriimonas sp.]|nr:hypothetical protein [Fimbriimonas sp.]
MKNHKHIAITAVAVLAVSAFAAGKIILRANMVGLGKGKAVWKIDDRDGRVQAELEASGENLPRNQSFTLVIGNNAPFAVTTDALGNYKLARRYTTSARPAISVGTPVVLKNAAGAVVQAGNFVP